MELLIITYPYRQKMLPPFSLFLDTINNTKCIIKAKIRILKISITLTFRKKYWTILNKKCKKILVEVLL